MAEHLWDDFRPDGETTDLSIPGEVRFARHQSAAYILLVDRLFAPLPTQRPGLFMRAGLMRMKTMGQRLQPRAQTLS